jgi:SNF2 family DNA or RNA helicase
VKTEVLLSELTNILKEHKALVFSQFSSMLDLLAEDCDKAGIKFYHFDGQTPPAQRMEMVKAFQEKDCTTNLFLISLKLVIQGLHLQLLIMFFYLIHGGILQLNSRLLIVHIE